MVPISLLAVTFLAEATYPFSITLDVSTLWGNLKAIEWAPFAVPRFWGELVVDRGLRYALLGGMLAVVLDRSLSRMPTRAVATGLVVAFAIGVELVKLLFEGRAPKGENAIVAIAGGLVGIAVLPAAARWGPLRRHPAAALAGLAIALLVHVEDLAPFEFRFDPATVRARVPRIEWLPFQSYYGAASRAPSSISGARFRSPVCWASRWRWAPGGARWHQAWWASPPAAGSRRSRSPR